MTIYEVRGNKRLGGRIRYLRKQAGMNQQQLADKLNVTQQAVSLMENGRGPKVHDIGRIARVLGVTTDELIDQVGYTSEPISVTGGAKAGTKGRGRRG